MIDWKEITTSPYCEYIYFGDINPFEYGGKLIHPQTGHIIEIMGIEDGLTNSRNQSIARIESRETGYNLDPYFSKKINFREVVDSCGCGFDVLKKNPDIKYRRALLFDALHSYGYSDPANEYPNNWYRETRSAIRAYNYINDYIRI